MFVLCLAALPWLDAAPALALDRCAVAAAFLDVRVLDKAETLYAAELKEDPSSLCAREGIERVGELQGESASEYERGEALLTLGQDEEARAAFLAALTADRSNTAAAEALERVDEEEPGGSGDVFAGVRNLAASGFEEAAAEEAERIVKDNPGSELPDDLAYLTDQPPPRFRRLMQFLEPLGQMLLQLAIPLGVVAALLILLVLWASHPKAKLLLKEFDVEAGGMKSAPAMTSVVRSAIVRLGDERQNARIMMISAMPEAVDVSSALSEAVPQLKLLGTLTKFLRRSSVHTLSGSLLAPGPDGVGISLSLESPEGRSAEAVVLWEKPLLGTSQSASADEGARAASYYGLAQVAAAWVVAKWQATTPGSPKVLGANSAASIVYFQAGVVRESRGDSSGARKMYVLALAEDGKNIGAMFNLAILDANRHSEYDRALERLERVVAHAETAEGTT